MDSFFGALKSERVHPTVVRTRDEASPDVFYYIEGFCSRRWLRSSLDCLSPEAHEQELWYGQHEIRLMPCPQN